NLRCGNGPVARAPLPRNPALSRMGWPLSRHGSLQSFLVQPRSADAPFEITSDNIQLSEPNELEIGTHSFELSHSDRERFHAVSLLRTFLFLISYAFGYYAGLSRVGLFLGELLFK